MEKSGGGETGQNSLPHNAASMYWDGPSETIFAKRASEIAHS